MVTIIQLDVRAPLRPQRQARQQRKVSAPEMASPITSGRSFSPLRLRGILVLDLGNGISGFAKSNQHSLGVMNTFFVTLRDLVPRRAVPRTGMINVSGFHGAC